MQEANTYARPFNNDLMPHFATFRARLQAVRERQQEAAASAAVALTPVPPHPTRLNDEQAQMAMVSVQQESMGGESMAAVHSGLEADRVARLLGLLD